MNYFQFDYYDYCLECQEYKEMHHNGLCYECARALWQEADELEQENEGRQKEDS